MDTIKTVADLPGWFKARKYAKGLTSTDWYREIRSRTAFPLMRETFGKLSSKDVYWADKLWDTHIAYIDWQDKPSSSIFEIDQNSEPVDDLSAFEAFFLSESIDDPELIPVRQSMSQIISMYRKESGDEDRALFSLEYEGALQSFVSAESTKASWVTVDVNEAGNPMLSYGRPLSGYPITVDTQYDDATIVAHFKTWLAERRRQDGEKARRPFNENDFSDWENYRIREIYDLQLWGKLYGVEILDKVLAAALWPTAPDSMSPLDHLRTTARKKTAEIFREEVSVRLYCQLRIQIGEDFLSI